MREAGNDLTARLLGHKHDSVRKLRPIVNLPAVLRNGSERDNIVEIESQCRVNVVNKCISDIEGEGCFALMLELVFSRRRAMLKHTKFYKSTSPFSVMSHAQNEEMKKKNTPHRSCHDMPNTQHRGNFPPGRITSSHLQPVTS